MAPFPAFRPPDKIEPELLQSVPRRVELRPMGALELIYSGVLNIALLLFGLAGPVSLLWRKTPVKTEDILWLLLPMILFGVPSLLRLVLMGAGWHSARELVARGELVRVEVEGVEVSTGKNAKQTISLLWPRDENDLFQNGEARRETITRPAPSPVFAEVNAIEKGQTLSVLQDGADTKRFVVYKFNPYRAV